MPLLKAAIGVDAQSSPGLGMLKVYMDRKFPGNSFFFQVIDLGPFTGEDDDRVVQMRVEELALQSQIRAPKRAILSIGVMTFARKAYLHEGTLDVRVDYARIYESAAERFCGDLNLCHIKEQIRNKKTAWGSELETPRTLAGLIDQCLAMERLQELDAVPYA